MRSKMHQVTMWFNSPVIPSWLHEKFKGKSPGGKHAVTAYRKLRMFYEAFPSRFTEEETSQLREIIMKQDNPEPSVDPVVLSRMVELAGNVDLSKKILSIDPAELYFTHERIYLEICV